MIENTKNPNHKFICPSCGEIDQNDVIFLCNTCSQADLIKKDDIYMCPSCLVPGDNFECFKCSSKHVKLVIKSNA